ncbi:hypothetical protein B0H10DRAFT_2191889 [Mycena sp. CBHHK59/15]|nr:hypothetical protein B0H10DRAFT_2191889 [Mycena sp. CBHHK59/15]
MAHENRRLRQSAAMWIAASKGIHKFHRFANLHIHIIAFPILLTEQVWIESDGGNGQLVLTSRAHGELQSSVHALVVVRIILDANRECAQKRPRCRVLAEKIVDDLPREAHVEHAERCQRGKNPWRGDKYLAGVANKLSITVAVEASSSDVRYKWRDFRHGISIWRPVFGQGQKSTAKGNGDVAKRGHDLVYPMSRSLDGQSLYPINTGHEVVDEEIGDGVLPNGGNKEEKLIGKGKYGSSGSGSLPDRLDCTGTRQDVGKLVRRVPSRRQVTQRREATVQLGLN